MTILCGFRIGNVSQDEKPYGNLPSYVQLAAFYRFYLVNERKSFLFGRSCVHLFVYSTKFQFVSLPNKLFLHAQKNKI